MQTKGFEAKVFAVPWQYSEGAGLVVSLGGTDSQDEPKVVNPKSPSLGVHKTNHHLRTHVTTDRRTVFMHLD